MIDGVDTVLSGDLVVIDSMWRSEGQNVKSNSFLSSRSVKSNRRRLNGIEEMMTRGRVDGQGVDGQSRNVTNGELRRQGDKDGVAETCWLHRLGRSGRLIALRSGSLHNQHLMCAVKRRRCSGMCEGVMDRQTRGTSQVHVVSMSADPAAN